LKQRQYQLAQGVDADLVRYNQKRYKLAFGLLGCAFLLGYLVSKVHIPDGVRLVVVGVATVCGLAGFVLAA